MLRIFFRPESEVCRKNTLLFSCVVIRKEGVLCSCRIVRRAATGRTPRSGLVDRRSGPSGDWLAVTCACLRAAPGRIQSLCPTSVGACRLEKLRVSSHTSNFCTIGHSDPETQRWGCTCARAEIPHPTPDLWKARN